MDRVDSFRVSESDLVQWENKCKALKNATTSSSGRSDGPNLGDLKDIHDTFYSDNLDNFKRNAIPSFELSISNGFIPLQKFTNEKIQGMDAEENIAKDLTVYRDNQQSLIGNCQTSSIGWSPIGEACHLYQVGRPCNGESSNHVLQALTQITPVLSEESRANVHSGAPPPWFEKAEETQLNGQLHTENNRNGSRKSGKSQKFNPNRVGAAWAEKRKIELEMEKRGETVNNNCDANWLPNFGRVWQSGSRKESRKEFETENERSLKTQILSVKPMMIQPYVSKRMRRDSGDSKD
ncbi:Titan-like protein [Thalictrum thalictroides]|uniref:Titan-like protein n=1 Tax=Thalictrum thalictroides TaxID=46969 RepID=A0A7J6VLN4_THATH|nr:Titan-like protein [Thalictrum thalictroides]